jgi:tRNA modification GTPase
MALFSLDDTIAAIATPLGEGGIGIIKISGPQAVQILQRLFAPPANQRESHAIPPPRRLTWGHITDPETGEIVDEVLTVVMPAPNSYTRQDVVEIQSHGGIVAVRKILQLVLTSGARLAEAGEMTLRAYINGRLDLAQAEAVSDIVQAHTDAALRVAVDQLEGHLSAQVRRARSQLIEVLAYLEASIDFVEDEIPPQDVLTPLTNIQTTVKGLLATADRGRIYRYGVRATIVGRPNVGKSSLLNMLLRGDRAIVTPIPGTTRDTLEETVNIQGIPVVLVDTAGIRQAAAEEVEQMGIDRSLQALERADMVLMVVDGSEPLTQEDISIAANIGSRSALVIINKSDLPPYPSGVETLPLQGVPHIHISAMTGQGIDQLEAAIAQEILGGQVIAADTPLVSSPRHQALLSAAAAQIDSAIEGHQMGRDADLIAIDVRDAVNSLGEITGETASEDLLETIFSRFCIGK